MAPPPAPAPAVVSAFQAAFAPLSTIGLLAATPQQPAYLNEALLHRLGLPTGGFDGLPPSAVLYDAPRHWLFLLEAVPAHGPIGPARQQEFAAWARPCSAGKLYLTAFPDHATFQAHAERIA